MKLLFIIPEYPPHFGGGIATFYYNLIPELAKGGHQVHVLVGSAFSGAFASHETQNIKVEFLDPQAVNTNLHRFNRYRAIPQLQRHLAAAWTAWEQVNGGEGYDVVETTDWGMLFAPWVVSPNSPPTVVQLHASIGQIDFYDPQANLQLEGSFTRLIETTLLGAADNLQTYSNSNARAWEKITGREVTYIPPALSPITILEPLEKSANGLVVGRIQYWKGPTTLCKALKLLDRKVPTIDWVGRNTVFGESGTSMSAYLAKAYPDIWGNKIRSIGTFSSQETRRLQQIAQFTIVPSIWDVFNYTCAEAMAQAQTVICSQGAGAADLIKNGVNGFTFKADNADRLAESLNTLLSLSQAERAEIGKAARQTILTELSPIKVAQQRIEQYEKLIKQGKSSSAHEWLLNAVSPSKPVDKPLAFLDNLPLKELSTYIFQRAIKKIN